MSSIRQLPCLAVLVLGTATCSDSGNPSGGGTFAVYITDTPFPYDRVARADLYIVRVEVGMDSAAAGGGPAVVEVASPGKTVDLLALQRGTLALLGTATLPTGQLQAVWITINTELSSLTLRDGRVLTATSSPVIDWSGRGERRIMADMPDPVPVSDRGGTVLIHFDVGRSFIPLEDVTPPRSDSGFAFIGTADALDPAATGTISGRLVSGRADGAPIPDASIRALVGDSGNPEGTWFVAATGATDADGKFKLAYLSPSSRWTGPRWVYNIAADPPSTTHRGPVRVKGVTVKSGVETALGILIAP